MVPAALILVFGACAAQRVPPAAPSAEVRAWMMDELEWQESKAFPGLRTAVLESGGGGEYTVRIRFPDGFRELPHWHTAVSRVTILSGAVYFGLGERFDPARVQRYGPGTFVIIPARQPHFTWAEGETVIQTHGVGERETVFVNPADDPRARR